VTAPKRYSAAAELAAVREAVSGLATDVAEITAAIAGLHQDADLAELIIGAKRIGYDEGRAERDPLAAEARARKARAQFKVLPGGKAPKARKGTAKAAPRKASGGAA
jgi:hypothetical protein